MYHLSYNAHDFTNRIPVSVIISWDSKGTILPLYIRLDGEPRKILSSSAYHSDSLGLNLLAFTCKFEEGGLLKSFLLYYHKKEGIWMAELPSPDG